MASSEQAARRAQKCFCPTVFGWGMTEVGVGVAMGFPEASEEARYLTSGHPLPGIEFKIIEAETGRSVPDGELGELCVRGYAPARRASGGRQSGSAARLPRAGHRRGHSRWTATGRAHRGAPEAHQVAARLGRSAAGPGLHGLTE